LCDSLAPGIFPTQDGDFLDDVIDAPLKFFMSLTVFFYDAHETELDMPTPEDSLPEHTPSGPKIILMCDPDYKQLHPFFGWLSPDMIKKTFEHTAQYTHLPPGTLLKKEYKSPNPALNIYPSSRRCSL
jgi:hypothetical protein